MIRLIEEPRLRQRVVTHARCGTLISLMLINIMAPNMTALISGRITVEIQVEVIQYGVIQQRKIKDGNIAIN